MTGIMALLLTDRRLGCILEVKDRGLLTNVNPSCVIAMLHQDKSQTRTQCKRRTVEPSNRQAPEKITSKYEIATEVLRAHVDVDLILQ